MPLVAEIFFLKYDGWYNLLRILPCIGILVVSLFAGVFCLVGVFIFLLGLRSLVARRTWIRDGFVHQRLRLLGIPGWRRCPCRAVTDVNHNDSSASNGKTRYDVVIERNCWLQRKRNPLYLFWRMTVATNVSTEREAEVIVQQLRKELNLPAKADGDG